MPGYDWGDQHMERKVARNITARFGDDLVQEIAAVSDAIQITLSEFLRRAAQRELTRVRSDENYPQLVAAEKERQANKLALLEPDPVGAGPVEAESVNNRANAAAMRYC